MKKRIFCLFISLILNAFYLPKYKSIKPDIESGIVYLDATQFDFNKDIHIQISSYNIYVNKTIQYDFSDYENYLTPSKEIKPASDFSSSTATISDEDKSFTNRYYYEILKDSSKKYLFFKFSGYRKVKKDGYLEIENIRINWGNFWSNLIIAGISLTFVICFGCAIYLQCKKINVERVKLFFSFKINLNIIILIIILIIKSLIIQILIIIIVIVMVILILVAIMNIMLHHHLIQPLIIIIDVILRKI